MEPDIQKAVKATLSGMDKSIDDFVLALKGSLLIEVPTVLKKLYSFVIDYPQKSLNFLFDYSYSSPFEELKEELKQLKFRIDELTVDEICHVMILLNRIRKIINVYIEDLSD